MNMQSRRRFLKNLFGAAVVAAIPKPVFDAIVAKSEPPVSPAVSGTQPIFTKERSFPSSILYIYKGNELIGQCENFHLNTEQHFIEAPKGEYKKVKFGKKYRWMYVPDLEGWKETYPIGKEWCLTAANMVWYKDGRDFLISLDKLQCLIKTQDYTIMGDVLLVELNMSISISKSNLDPMINDCKFVGTGQLMYNENTRPQKQV
jgi:hypothetical protein